MHECSPYYTVFMRGMQEKKRAGRAVPVQGPLRAKGVYAAGALTLADSISTKSIVLFAYAAGGQECLPGFTP